MGAVARRGLEAVWERRKFRRRMCGLPHAAGQHELCVHHADRGPAMRPLYHNILPVGLGMLVALAGCSSQQPKVVATLNRNAFLTGELPANPLQWRVIGTLIDQSASSMSTL